MPNWIDDLTDKCQRAKEAELISREMYKLAERYSDSAFDRLIAAMRDDVNYFKGKCQEASAVSESANRAHPEFTVKTPPPHSSKVIVLLDVDRLKFEKSVRRNPRSAPCDQTGYMLVKSNYDRSIWLEYEGQRIDFEAAAEFLLKELFEALLEKG